MRFLLAAALILTASTAFADGRYQGVSTGSGVIFVLDTKTGKTRICVSNGIEDQPVCSPWTEE